MFGSTYFYADTADMEPEIEQGMFVKAKPCDTYKLGDAVAYRARSFNGERIVIGEIVRATDGGFTVCGINSASSNVNVDADAILGKADTVNEKVEGLLYPLSDGIPCLLYVVVPAVVTLLYGTVRMLYAIKERRSQQK